MPQPPAPKPKPTDHLPADKREWEWFQEALAYWQQKNLVSTEQAEQLRNSIDQKTGQRQQLAQYFFIIALSCGLCAFAAVFINDKLIERVRSYFELRQITVSLFAAGMSIAYFWWIQRRKTPAGLVREIQLLPGTLLGLIALVYGCKMLDRHDNYMLFTATATVMLLSLSLYFHSAWMWICGLAVSAVWFGIFSTMNSSGNLFMGMNYAVRFVFWGLLLLVFGYLCAKVSTAKFLAPITRHGGLLLLLVALWCVSIFGNYGTMAEWEAVRQTRVLAYAFVFGVVAIGCIVWGVRSNDSAIRDYGILFLIVNIYTRYFEFFWDAMSKGIFFIILAILFWLTGWLITKRNRIFSGET